MGFLRDLASQFYAELKELVTRPKPSQQEDIPDSSAGRMLILVREARVYLREAAGAGTKEGQAAKLAQAIAKIEEAQHIEHEVIAAAEQYRHTHTELTAAASAILSYISKSTTNDFAHARRYAVIALSQTKRFRLDDMTILSARAQINTLEEVLTNFVKLESS